MTVSKPAWLTQLEEDGFVVIPNVVPKEACEKFQESALQWLEKFHGFKRDDKSTWDAEHLPYGVTGGLYNRYAVNHEQFVWDIRVQPAILDAFAQIWGTHDLIASFDGMNVSLPLGEHGRTDIQPTPAWPHIDQNPRRTPFELYQGIANLAPNGPEDGGLCVLKGSHKLHEEHFASIGGFRPECDAGPDQNSYKYNEEDFGWYKKRCETVKVCAPEGGLILWDSRTIHWNASPVGKQTRFATYVCYAPRRYLDAAGLEKKREVFEARKGTTHWPHMNVVPQDRKNYAFALATRPDGTRDPMDRDRPFDDVKPTPEVLRLVGVSA